MKKRRSRPFDSPDVEYHRVANIYIFKSHLNKTLGGTGTIPWKGIGYYNMNSGKYLGMKRPQ